MGERETGLCIVCGMATLGRICSPECDSRAPAPAEAVAKEVAEALLQVRDLALGAPLRDDHLMHVDVLARAIAAPLGRAEVGEEMVGYARQFVDAAIKQMSTNLHGSPNTMAFVEDCLLKARAALARPDRERGE